MPVDLAPDRSLLAALRAQPERPAPRRPWLRLLTEILQMAGPQAEFLRHAERPWFSATFSGSRHTIALAFHGDEALGAGEALIDSLPDHEFAIPGHLVADAAVLAVEHVNGPDPRMTIEVELLLLENL